MELIDFEAIAKRLGKPIRNYEVPTFDVKPIKVKRTKKAKVYKPKKVEKIKKPKFNRYENMSIDELVQLERFPKCVITPEIRTMVHKLSNRINGAEVGFKKACLRSFRAKDEKQFQHANYLVDKWAFEIGKRKDELKKYKKEIYTKWKLANSTTN